MFILIYRYVGLVMMVLLVPAWHGKSLITFYHKLDGCRMVISVAYDRHQSFGLALPYFCNLDGFRF